MNVERRGRQKERSKSKSNGKSKTRANRSKSRSKGITCWKCGKKGHAKKYCWLKDKENQKPDKGKEENLAASEVMQNAVILSLDSRIESWVLDSGASFHANPNKGYFRNYVQGNFGHVYLGDDEPCSITGKGEVHLKLQNKNTWVLKDVRHVSNLVRNLISARKLGEVGCVVTFIGDS